MGAYRTVVVGTDGSDTSLRAVARAGALAGAAGATLVVVCAYLPVDDDRDEYSAVTNVGLRPTFGSLRRTIEAYLLDWNGDLYGKTIRVAFLRRLRGEQKFSGIDALIAQIKADVTAAREMLAQ